MLFFLDFKNIKIKIKNRAHKKNDLASLYLQGHFFVGLSFWLYSHIK